MANIYISTTGNDTTGDGSSGNRYATVSKGLSVAADGDTVIVGAGTYNSEYPVTPGAGRNIILQSESGDFADTIVYAKTAGTGGWVYTGTGGAIFKVYNLTFILDASVAGIGTGSGAEGRIFWINSHSAVNYYFVKCFFFATGFDALLNRPTGITNRYTEPQVYLYKCTARGFKSNYGTPTDGAKFIKNWDGSVFIDCAFEGNTAVCQYAPTGNSNNSVYNNSYLATASTWTLGVTEIATDPTFSSASSAVTNVGSPCIDAGVTIAGYVETYEGLAPDIGCYEMPGSTEVSVSDVGALSAETVSIFASMSLSDSGAGSESVLPINLALSITDVGVAVDTVQSITHLFTVTDTGALLSEDITLGVKKFLTVTDAGMAADTVAQIVNSLGVIGDYGSGADVINVISTFVSLLDSGSTLQEAIATLSVALHVSDVVSATDLINKIKNTLGLDDAGLGSMTTQVTNILPVIHESGALDDENISITNSVTLTTTGTGNDTITDIARLIQIIENYGAVEALLLAIYADIIYLSSKASTSVSLSSELPNSTVYLSSEFSEDIQTLSEFGTL